jgi:hypothetical protein
VAPARHDRRESEGYARQSRARWLLGEEWAVGLEGRLREHAPAAWPQDETLPFSIDGARLAADRHTVVVGGTYACGPLDLDVVGGGATDLTVRQGAEGFGGVAIEVCDGTIRAWQADVTIFGEHPFKRGAARANASGLVNGERDGQPVTLRVDIPDQRIAITRRWRRRGRSSRPRRRGWRGRGPRRWSGRRPPGRRAG